MAGLEGLKPARVPSWLSEGEWAEPGTVPGPSAHSQLCPHPPISSLRHATQEHGTRPITRAHRHRQGKVTGRQEVGTETQKGIMTGGGYTSWLAQRAAAKDKEDGRRRNCCAGVWYGADEVGCFTAASGKLLNGASLFFCWIFF